MNISKTGIQLITNYEGLFLHAYPDPGTNSTPYTIGYGTICYPSDQKVKLGDTITQEQAIEYLMFEVDQKTKGIEDLVDVDLTQTQFDALVSWTYNLGLGALKESTLLKDLNNNDFDSVPNEILKWNRANGHVMGGLVRRRKTEAYYFKTGILKFDFSEDPTESIDD